jgi:hypothetical protein
MCVEYVSVYVNDIELSMSPAMFLPFIVRTVRILLCLLESMFGAKSGDVTLEVMYIYPWSG